MHVNTFRHMAVYMQPVTKFCNFMSMGGIESVKCDKSTLFLFLFFMSKISKTSLFQSVQYAQTSMFTLVSSFSGIFYLQFFTW